MTNTAPATDSRALASCPDCHGAISPSAETCPHCGCPFARRAVEVIPGPRWSWTVYWGLVLFVLIPVAISAVLAAGIILAIMAATAGNR